MLVRPLNTVVWLRAMSYVTYFLVCFHYILLYCTLGKEQANYFPSYTVCNVKYSTYEGDACTVWRQHLRSKPQLCWVRLSLGHTEIVSDSLRGLFFQRIVWIKETKLISYGSILFGYYLYAVKGLQTPTVWTTLSKSV